MSHSLDDDAFVLFAQQRWLLSEEEAQRCLKRCRETGRPAMEVAQELELLNHSLAQLVLDLAAEADVGAGGAGPVVTLPAPQELAPASPDARVEMAGLTVGRYELLGPLGCGSQGAVFAAHDPKLGRDVAVKVFSSAPGSVLVQSEHELQRFVGEARRVAALGPHPNVVEVYDIGDGKAVHYFVMQLVRGTTFEGWCEERPRTPREIAALGRDIAQGLAHAHAHGITHRDVKPANVLVNEQSRALVTDFGLARGTEGDSSLTATGIVMGTPAYMSPEQARGRTDEVGPASDVYALGVVLYEALAGRHPFDHDSLLLMMVAHAHEEPVPLRQANPAVPVGLETIVMRCMEKAPAKRYRDGAALVEDLAAWLAGRVREDRRGRAGSAERPNLALVVAGAVLMLLLTAGVLTMMSGIAGKPPPGGGTSSPPSVAVIAPRVKLDQPYDGLVTGDSEVRVAGEVVAGTLKAVWLQGRAISVSGGLFSTTLELPPGATSLSLRSSPEGPVMATARVFVDLDPPILDIKEPQPGQVVGGERITLAGTVREGHLESLVVVGGEELVVDERGAFSVSIELPEGDGGFDVQLMARDRAGNLTDHSVKLVVDRTPPVVQVISPATDSLTRESLVTLRGWVEDASRTQLEVNGELVAVADDGAFLLELPLEEEGLRELTLQATDAAGHASQVTWRIVRDATSPVLLLDAPPAGLVTAAAIVEVRGRVTDENVTDTVSIGDLVETLASDGRFRLELPLEEGETTIVVVAEDQAGNRVKVERRVVCDTMPPSIMLSPRLPKQLIGRERRVRVRGRVSEQGCVVTVNQEPVAVRDQVFETEVRLREEGENLIAILVTDRAGNSQRHEEVVHYFRRPPKLPAGTWWEPTARQLLYAKKSKQPLWIENDLGMRLVLIPPGRFVMGTPATSPVPGHKNEVPHQVTLKRGFYIGATEVTTGQLKSFMKQRANADDPEDLPAAWIFCEEMQDFCEWLTRQARGKWLYRLPTDAEWEYTYRAETTTPWFWGDDPDEALRYGNMLDEVAKPQLPGTVDEFIPGDDGHVTRAPVGSYAPSPYGLFDMAGNCHEVTWGAYPPGATWGAREPALREGFVLRGSSFHNAGWTARSAKRSPIWSNSGRSKDDPDGREVVKYKIDIGFRVVAIPLRAGAGR